MKHKVLFTLFFSTSSLFIYALQASQHKEQDVNAITLVEAENSALTIEGTHSIASGTSLQIINAQNDQLETYTTQAAALEKYLERHESSEDEKKLKTLFDDDFESQLYLKGILAGKNPTVFPDGLQDAQRLNDLYLTHLKRHPQKALAAIQSTLPRLNLENFSMERSLLVASTAAFSKNLETVKSILQKELITEQSENVDASFERSTEVSQRHSFYIVTTFQTYLSVEEDLDTAMEQTLNAIKHHPKEGLRITLLQTFLEKYPAEERRISHLLKDENINIEVPSQLAQHGE
jgi:hypothetical protein